MAKRNKDRDLVRDETFDVSPARRDRLPDRVAREVISHPSRDLGELLSIVALSQPLASPPLPAAASLAGLSPTPVVRSNPYLVAPGSVRPSVAAARQRALAVVAIRPSILPSPILSSQFQSSQAPSGLRFARDDMRRCKKRPETNRRSGVGSKRKRFVPWC